MVKPRGKSAKSRKFYPRRIGVGMRLRNYFLTGLVIAAPVSITIYLTWTFIQWIDSWVKPLIPSAYNPDTYLPFSIPGGGLVFAVLGITLLGFLTAGLVGKTIVSYGETLLGRMPFVRNLYNALKQIFETVISNRANSFQKAALLEYPRRGLWSIAFLATEAKGEIRHRIGDEKEIISIFLPTTPNPTSGFLLFVPRSDLIVLDMSVEEAAKLVISAGLVAPEFERGKKPLQQVPLVAAEKPEEARQKIEEMARVKERA